MPEDKNKNVRDLTMRRQKQIQKTDPVMILADEMTKLVASWVDRMTPEEQLVAIELTARALLTTLMHAHGPEILNYILVEVEHKKKQYSMQWPVHDNSPTIYDDYKPMPNTHPSEIVKLHPEKE